MVWLTEHDTFVRKIDYGSKRAWSTSTVQFLYSETKAQFLQWGLGHSYVFLEEPVVAGVRNLRTTIKIAETAGAVIAAACGAQGTYLVPVSSWKKGTHGSGNAGKSDVRTWLADHHPTLAAECGDDQDLVDAACVALHGRRLVERGHDIGTGVLLLDGVPELA